MLRRLKRDVMAELPPKRRQVVRLPRPKSADWPNQEVPEGQCFSGFPTKQLLDSQARSAVPGTVSYRYCWPWGYLTARIQSLAR